MSKIWPFFFGICLYVSACKPIEPADEEPIMVFTGSVTKPVKEVLLPAVAYKANLGGLLRPGDTSSVSLVAYGGSLLAGFRDGGLYRTGQQTAIPALIAHQMSLVSFVSPLFEQQVGNGTGYLEYDQTNPLPSWKRVTNNLGVLFSNPLTLSKYTGPAPDNLALPYGVRPGAADSSLYIYFYPGQKQYFTYLNRLFPPQQEGKYAITYFLDSRKINLLLYEPDLDQWLGIAANPEFVSNTMSRAGVDAGTIYSAYEKVIKDNINMGRKVILFNWPDFMDFPYFHLYDARKLKALNIATGVALEDSTLLIPNDKIKRAFAQKGTLPVVLEDKDVLSKQEVNLFKSFVASSYLYGLPDLSKFTGMPVVDLYSLYKKVMNRQYTTEDGLFIDPSFPNGNFFSQDGIYPSAIGSAVIANETIKVINKAYQTNIPLMNVREFASRL